MKKISIIFTALFAVSLLLVSWNKVSKVAGAVHIGPISCGILDGDGNIFVTPDGTGVITSSGNVNFKCKAKGIPNSTGGDVVWNYANTSLLCNTTAGVTDLWENTVSASGNATLQCKFRP